MNKMIARTFAAAALASVMAVLPAQASPIKWNLNDVTFDDGTKATGSFTIDATNKTWTAFDITTQDGKLTALDYTPGNSGLYFNGFGSNSFIILNTAVQRYINFSFDQALALPGTFAISTANSWECNNCSTFRRVTAGGVTAEAADVPEPASLALMLPALGMIGLARRRKQK